MEQKTWFTQEVKACELSLYRLAYSILKDEEDAADAAQEAICIAYQKLSALRNREKFRPWLMKILANTCYAMLRQRQKIIPLDVVPEPEAPESEETETPLFCAVSKLPQTLRATIVLYYYEDFSVKEIASILKLSEANVKARLSRGRKQLRVLLMEELS